MMRANPAESAIRRIRQEVIEDIALVVGITGTFATIFALVRDLSVGRAPWGVAIPAGMVLLLLSLRLLRVRIRSSLSGVSIVGGLLLVGFNGLLVYGVTAPSAYLVPTAVLMAWMLFGGRVASSILVLAAVVFVLVARRVVESGTVSSVLLDQRNSSAAYWLNLGTIELLVALIIIVTLRKLVLGLVMRETQSRHERDRCSGMFEALQDAVFVHSIPDGTVLERNGSARSMFGMTDSGSAPTGPGGIFPWTDDDVSARFRLAMDEGPQRFVCRGRRGGGEPFWCEASMRVFPVSGSGKMVVSVRDVDDRIRHQIELQRLNEGLESSVSERTENLERSRKELEAFSYAVAHDLRSPLRAVNGYGKVLQEEYRDVLDSTGRTYVERIVAGTVRMGNLIDALLDLSRIDRTTICNVPVDMASVVRECCEELEMAMRSSNRQHGGPVVAWSIDALPECLSDTELVRQIWANLLSNAFKFSARAAAPRVEVGFENRDDGIWYTVSDNGCGFDMSHADKLFGVFQRLHDHSVEGLGIGLATVKRILQRMDGEIEFEGAPGRGAIFRFRPYPMPSLAGVAEQDSTSLLVASGSTGTSE